MPSSHGGRERMAEKYDAIVIGTGQAGPGLTAELAGSG